MCKTGFLLLEFLVILGLISGLTVFAVFVLHPSELWKQFQDAKKISEANQLKAELSDYFLKNPAADCNSSDSPAASLPTGIAYVCDPETKIFKLTVDLESNRYVKSGQPKIYKTGNDLNF